MVQCKNDTFGLQLKMPIGRDSDFISRYNVAKKCVHIGILITHCMYMKFQGRIQDFWKGVHMYKGVGVHFARLSSGPYFSYFSYFSLLF